MINKKLKEIKIKETLKKQLKQELEGATFKPVTNVVRSARS